VQVAQCLVALAVALGNSDGVVVVLVIESVVRDVSNSTKTTSTIQVVLEIGFNAGPNLDSCTIAGIGHGDVVDVEILNNIHLTLVLA
jgi:hypothetical protein